MTTLADDWGVHPEHFWLRGRQAEHAVTFDEKLGLWSVYGYPETMQVLSDPETFSSATAKAFMPEADDALFEGNLAQTDPPDHRKLRRLANHAFTPKTVTDLEPRIAELTHELLDATAGRDRLELVADLAYPLAVIVIAELLGVPASDRDLFRKWAEMMFESANEFSLAEDNEEQERDLQNRMDAAGHMTDYLRTHVAERRREPRQDLLSALVAAEVDGETLSDNQAVNFANLLLFAGHVTTTMLLGNTVLCLDAHPEQLARVRADRTTLPAVIEESLRFLSPFATSYRVTTKDIQLGDRAVPAGAVVKVWISAANRDPRIFTNPDIFDPTRDPNPHIGFGRGIHFCLGAPLARLEGKVVLDILLDRYPTLTRDPQTPPTFMPTPDFVGVSTLWLRTA